MVKNDKKISYIVQGKILKRDFPNSELILSKEEFFIWTGAITPTIISDSYKVKIVYGKNTRLSVYVIEPKPLSLAENEKRLPHVYSHKEQRLCLYYPREWLGKELITKTILPWTSEWLFHYECWVITGEWRGKGIHPVAKTPIKKKNER